MTNTNYPGWNENLMAATEAYDADPNPTTRAAFLAARETAAPAPKRESIAKRRLRMALRNASDEAGAR